MFSYSVIFAMMFIESASKICIAPDAGHPTITTFRVALTYAPQLIAAKLYVWSSWIVALVLNTSSDSLCILLSLLVT